MRKHSLFFHTLFFNFTITYLLNKWHFSATLTINCPFGRFNNCSLPTAPIISAATKYTITATNRDGTKQMIAAFPYKYLLRLLP